MPGTIRLPINPRGGQRQLHSLRGTVTAHSVQRVGGWRIFGLWIFGQRIPTLEIHLNPAQVTAFNRLAHASMSVDDGRNLRGIAGNVSIGMVEDQLSTFPVGASVGVTFGYAGPISQFFEGRDPLAVVNLQVVGQQTVLENEIVPQHS